MIAMNDITSELWTLLEQLAPFGQANPEPVFAAHHVRVRQAYPVGKDQKHLKLIVEQNGVTKNAIAFGFGPFMHKLSYSQTINIAFRIEENIWNNQTSLQLKIKDIKIQD